jgi:hypothetical protein
MKMGHFVIGLMVAGLLVCTLLIPPVRASAQTLSASTDVALAAGPQTFQGKGKQVTPKFTLEQGLAVVRGSQTGRSNFIVEVVDDMGRYVGLGANVIGSVQSTRVVRAGEKGEYLMNVTADGSWTITVDQPKPISPRSLPVTFSGSGDAVTEFVQLPPGLVTARAPQTSGRSNFIVQAVSPDGRFVGLLANEIGVATSSKALSGNGQVILLAVNGDGAWTISLE